MDVNKHMYERTTHLKNDWTKHFVMTAVQSTISFIIFQKREIHTIENKENGVKHYVHRYAHRRMYILCSKRITN